MAQCFRFQCDSCGHAIEAWDDGNPYYRDEAGKKHYAYHPSTERELCIGNDTPQLCLSCGAKFKSDSLAPAKNCRKCKSADFVQTGDLDGRNCPYCGKGIFRRDADFFAIS